MAETGLDHLHAHRFRHTIADARRRSGLDDDSRARGRYQKMVPGDSPRAVVHKLLAEAAMTRP